MLSASKLIQRVKYLVISQKEIVNLLKCHADKMGYLNCTKWHRKARQLKMFASKCEAINSSANSFANVYLTNGSSGKMALQFCNGKMAQKIRRKNKLYLVFLSAMEPNNLKPLITFFTSKGNHTENLLILVCFSLYISLKFQIQNQRKKCNVCKNVWNTHIEGPILRKNSART